MVWGADPYSYVAAIGSISDAAAQGNSFLDNTGYFLNYQNQGSFSGQDTAAVRGALDNALKNRLSLEQGKFLTDKEFKEWKNNLSSYDAQKITTARQNVHRLSDNAWIEENLYQKLFPNSKYSIGYQKGMGTSYTDNPFGSWIDTSADPNAVYQWDNQAGASGGLLSSFDAAKPDQQQNPMGYNPNAGPTNEPYASSSSSYTAEDTNPNYFGNAYGAASVMNPTGDVFPQQTQQRVTPFADAYMRAKKSAESTGPVSSLFKQELNNGNA